MISPRQIEERELRRKRILEGALEVFHKNGLEGATMDEIAHEAGFGKATLYYYCLLYTSTLPTIYSV